MSTVVVGVDELNRKLTQLARVFEPGTDLSGALLKGGEEMVSAIQENILAQGLFDRGDLYDNVRVERVSGNAVVVISDRPYSAAQEFGLDRQPITGRQRAFFWAMWAAEADEMWKALALSETYTIPAKPYFRPGVDQSKGDVLNTIAFEFLKMLIRGSK